jgi:CubicO group peptidase (beta-lactamase class C family)
VQTAIGRLVSEGVLPGAVVHVQRGDHRAYCEAFGKQVPAAAGDELPMRTDSVFRIYSMTKPIVSLATLMLMEEGRLLLSQPVSRWLPAFANQHVYALDKDNGLPRSEPVLREASLHDLLRHTAGLSYAWEAGTVEDAYRAARIGSRRSSNAELAKALGPLPLLRQPGSAWEYSRATDVLGAVLEVVTGESLGVLLQRMIFGPLGMKETSFHVPEALHPRLAEAFPRDPQTDAAVALLDVKQPARFESGGGGLTSTAADYSRFLDVLRGRGTANGMRLISPATMAFMLSDHIAGLPVVGTILPQGYGFGLGVAVRRAAGGASRTGSTGQVSWSGLGGTAFFFDPTEDLYAIVLAQAPGQLEHLIELLPNLVYAGL